MTHPALQIVACRAEDIPTLAAVALHAYRDHYTHLWTDNGAWYEDRCFTPPVLGSEMNEPGSYFYLIYRQGAPVGFLKLNDANPLDGYPAEDCLEVERLYLLAAATGGGIGKAAMDFAEALARERGRKVVWLKTMDSSPAVHFYEKTGFRKCAETRLPFPVMKEEFRNMFVMKKELP